MTVPTSDERREVAERLRKEAKTVNRNSARLWTRLEIAVNGWKYGNADHEPYAHFNDVFARLADLIDPTCHDFGGEEGTNGEGYDFACSACGYACDIPEPSYCPNCGARVVSDDD